MTSLRSDVTGETEALLRCVRMLFQATLSGGPHPGTSRSANVLLPSPSFPNTLLFWDPYQ